MKLYQHQLDARTRFRHTPGCALFWKPGCGKSAASLALAVDKYKAGEIDSVIIIAPNRLHTQWALEQIPTWCGSTLYPSDKQDPKKKYNVFVQYKKLKKGKQLEWREGMLNIVCVNIESFSTQSYYSIFTSFASAHRTMLILDEASVIKNPDSLRSQRLLYGFNDVVRKGKKIVSSVPKTVARVILTGTPVTESPLSLWALFEFLSPNFFHQNYYAFSRTYCLYQTLSLEGGSRSVQVPLTREVWEKVKGGMSYGEASALFGISLSTYSTIISQTSFQGPYIKLSQLSSLISPYTSWVSLEDITEMPDKVYVKRVLDMSDEQEKVYKEMKSKFVAYYKDKEVDATTKVAVQLRLQQIASGFITSLVNIPDDATDEEVLEFLADPPPREVTWFDKNVKVEQLLEDLKGAESGVILTHFTAEASKLYDVLSEVYGKDKINLQTGWKRVGTIESFKEGKEKFMVANIRVVSKGFNFQALCHQLFFYSNTFSLEDREQSEARIHRLGQKEKCVYFDYVMKDTVDEDVWRKLKLKEEVSDSFWSNSSGSDGSNGDDLHMDNEVE